MPSLAELTDQYPQQDTSLPVTQPYRGANLGPLQPVTFAPIGNTQLTVPVSPDVVAQPDPNSVGTNDDSWLTKINNAAKKFTNYDRQMTEDVINLPKTISNMSSADGSQIIDKLLGLGGQERYQLWPEKVVRDAISAPHDIMQANPYPEGSEEASWFEDQRGKDMVPAALNMSALAGTGGLAGIPMDNVSRLGTNLRILGMKIGEQVGEDGALPQGAALGAGPFLRPALKVGDKIYKAPIKDAENPLGFGAEHSDALPAHLADDFYKKAMSGEDINDYNFGFVNHKGQFLDREKALDYGIQQGLVDPQNGKYGVLTSTMLADSSKPGTAIEAMAKTGQPFYSALEHNVNAIQQSKMTGDQWLGTLANKPGVKPEEMDWTGVKDFLKEKGNQPVSKSELQEHLQNNKVELKEVDKGELKFNKKSQYALPEVIKAAKESGDTPGELEMVLANDGNAYRALTKKFPHLAEDEDWAEKVAKDVFGGDSMPSGTTKYHSYQLAGGENYREKLLTLPTGTQKYNEFIKEIRAKHGEGGLSKLPLSEAERKAYETRLAGAENDENSPAYKSSHWDEPNILAHVRMNDRMIDGKKSLHLEEIQSDWAQQGKKAGFQNPKNKASEEEIMKLVKADSEARMAASAATEKAWKEATNGKAENLRQWTDTGIDRHELRRAQEYVNDNKERSAAYDKSIETARALNEAVERGKKGVPDMPFKNTSQWVGVALKRMIREAASGGYDRLSWTPGEAQAARYDLSKQIRELRYDPKTNDIYAWEAKQPKGVGPSIAQKATPEELTNVVGKEAAKKLLETKINEKGMHVLEGQDLKIGGEGMKGFYDQIIPKSLEKISGEKVKTTNLPVAPKEFKKEWLNLPPEEKAKLGQPVHYIDIPQSLKDKALGRGFPLFSSTHMFTPISGNPFNAQNEK